MKKSDKTLLTLVNNEIKHNNKFHHIEGSLEKAVEIISQENDYDWMYSICYKTENGEIKTIEADGMLLIDVLIEELDK